MLANLDVGRFVGPRVADGRAVIVDAGIGDRCPGLTLGPVVEKFDRVEKTVAGAVGQAGGVLPLRHLDSAKR